jgi:hypothetical protein
MRIRKRNRILKRIVLGFAVLALVVPAGRVKAMPDAGRTYQPEVGSVIRDWPGHNPNAFAGSGTPVGMPHAGLNNYLQSRDGVELVRLQPRSTLRVSDPIEKVRVASRVDSTPQSVASPGVDWKDAGIGAGLTVGLLLLGAAAFFGTRHLGRPQTA